HVLELNGSGHVALAQPTALVAVEAVRRKVEVSLLVGRLEVRPVAIGRRVAQVPIRVYDQHISHRAPSGATIRWAAIAHGPQPGANIHAPRAWRQAAVYFSRTRPAAACSESLFWIWSQRLGLLGS